MKHIVAAFFLILSSGHVINAYVLEGPRWLSTSLSMPTNLSATAYRLAKPPASPLIDGTASCESVFTSSAAMWNQYMATLQIATSVSNNANGGELGNSVNEVFFASSVGVATLDSSTLGPDLL